MVWSVNKDSVTGMYLTLVMANDYHLFLAAFFGVKLPSLPLAPMWTRSNIQGSVSHFVVRMSSMQIISYKYINVHSKSSSGVL